MPHGGFKQSGYGKDMSKYALEDYTIVKHVMVNLEGREQRVELQIPDGLAARVPSARPCGGPSGTRSAGPSGGAAWSA